MIGVLTSNFSFYYELITSLKKREMPFISLTFHQPIPPNVKVIITTIDEKKKINFENVLAYKGGDIGILIDKAILMRAGENASKKIIIGIDPGLTPGLAVFGNGILLRKFLANGAEDVVNFVALYAKEWGRENLIVRIGHGARLVRNRIINLLREMDICIEIVDETSTTSADDTLSAFSIARMSGKLVEKEMVVEPKEGEIKDIQRKSRIVSGDITISKSLAEKVLKGEIGMEEAIEKQRKKLH